MSYRKRRYKRRSRKKSFRRKFNRFAKSTLAHGRVF